MNDSQPFSAVLDTNIYVSALIKPTGNCAKIVTAGLVGKFRLIASAEIIWELYQIWQKQTLQAYVSTDKVLELVQILANEVQIVDPVPFTNFKYPNADYRQIDRKHEHIYRAFKASQANYLVTGNAQFFPTEDGIINPKKLFQLI